MKRKFIWSDAMEMNINITETKNVVNNLWATIAHRLYY